MEVSSQQSKPITLLLGVILMYLLLFLFSLSGSPVLIHEFGLAKINGLYLFATRLCYWLCLVITGLYAYKIERQKLLLWEEKKYKPLFYLLSIIALSAAILFATGIGEHIIAAIIRKKEHSDRLQEMIDIFRVNKFLLFFTAFTAGVTEELLFRGYLLPRLQLLFKNAAVAIFISAFLFGLMHYRYGTLDNAIGPFIIGLIFAIYYWKYQNISVLILFHFMWDVFGIYALLKH